MTGLSVLDAAREAPDAVALVDGGRTLSFADVASRVVGEVEALAEVGVGGARGADRVALTAAVSVDFAVRLYALLELGVAAVLLHPRWTEAERRRALAAAPGIRTVDDLPSSPAADGPHTLSAPTPPDPGATLAVVFTSGSAGAPKGVVLSRAAFAAAASASAARLGWTTADRWLLSLPPAHVGGLSVLVRCLIARRPAVLADAGDPGAVVRAVERHGVTLVSLVPPQLRRLLADGRRAPDGLRAVLLGGGPADAALLDDAAAAGWPVLPTYGLSETCSQVATVPPGTAPAASNGVGPPLPGVEVRIRHGEIQVRGAMVMDGYLPADSCAEPFTEDGWLATGDIGAIDEAGKLHVAGRRDDVIVTGGENVMPQEVEAALAACPGVREAAVFGLPDPDWGQLVVAAVVAGPGFDPDAARPLLDARLAPFKRPRRIVAMDALPRTPSGKVDRRSLRRRFA